MQAPDCQAKNAHSESRSSSRPEFQSWLRYRRGGVRPLVGGDRDQGEEATCLPSRRRREGGFEPSLPRKEKALLRDRPFELSGTGAPERSALCGSKPSSRSRALSHAAAGFSVPAVPIRSPNCGELQALGLCRRENTTLFREAVDASAIRTAGRATAPSGRRGRRQDPGDHRRRAQQHPSSISFSWNACSYCYSPRHSRRVAIPSSRCFHNSALIPHSLQASRGCTLARTFVSPPRVLGRVGVLGGTTACS